jgi:hypothetical protein
VTSSVNSAVSGTPKDHEEKLPSMLVMGVIILCDIACYHAVCDVQDMSCCMCIKSYWDCPLYSADLSLCYFPVIDPLKKVLKAHRIILDEDIRAVVVQ